MMGSFCWTKPDRWDGLPESTWTDPEILEKYRTGSEPDLYPNTDWIKNYMKVSHTTGTASLCQGVTNAFRHSFLSAITTRGA